MTDDTQRYALGRLILDYIRTFLWPAVALAVVLVYQDDVRTILQEREVDIFGLRIGEKVQQIETHTLAEIGDIRALLDEQQASGTAPANADAIATDIEAKLASLERNLSREVAAVRSAEVQPAPEFPSAAQMPASSRMAQAADAERQGFQALIERDVGGAMEAFDEARRIQPDFHNVAEIGRLLRDRRDKLGKPDSPEWPRLYREILTRYSWGLPDNLRPQLREGAAQAYPG